MQSLLFFFANRNVTGNEAETVYTAVQYNLELKTLEVNKLL